jgi:hypothetical protein
MLRHFAAVTVVATVCLALFANGENAKVSARGTDSAAAASAESGGAMFGAEEAALKKSREGGKREVNGITIGKNTRLENNTADVEADSGPSGGGGVGNIDNFYGTPGAGDAAPLPMAASAASQSAPPSAGVPQPVLRDASGVPIPAFAAKRVGPPGTGNAQRAPSREDIARLQEESRQQNSGSALFDD